MSAIERTAAILTVGDELINGQLIDTNSAWIAALLEEHGWRVSIMMSVGDEVNEIVSGIGKCSDAADLIIVTGGLGPTQDDLTLDALADYFQVEKIWHEPTWQHIQHLYTLMGREASVMQRRQCFLPTNAEVIQNNQGTAPGTVYRHNGKILVSTPGVPGEMKHLLRDKIIGTLPHGHAPYHHHIRTAGVGETVIAEMIADIEASLSSAIKLAYLPSWQQVTLRLTTYDVNSINALESFAEKIRQRLGTLAFHPDAMTISEDMGILLRNRKETLGTAESCTGGYLAHLITAVSGSSDYYTGSVISYAYEVKMTELDVSEDVLQQHGVVSQQVAEAMAVGARKALGVNWALATTGIAGPGGGTPDKPVGTVWIACAGPYGVTSRLLNLKRDRLGNIESAAITTLVMLRKTILEAGGN